MKNTYLLAIALFCYCFVATQAQEAPTLPFDKPYKSIVKTPSGYVEVEYFSPQYETISEQRLISPSSLKWIKGTPDWGCGCGREGPCKIWHLKEIPSQYKTVTKKVLTKPLTWTETPLWLPNIEQELKPFDFTLSPKPTEAQLHIDADHHYQAAKLYLTNISGGVVFEQNIAQGESEFWIDVAHLPAGIYAVWFIDAQQHLMKNHDNKFAKK